MSFTLPPLPYPIDALEPYISRRTLVAHHDHHHSGYVEKVRTLTQRTPLDSVPLERVVVAAHTQDRKLFNAAAQAWNHEFYWHCLRPGGGGPPRGLLAEHIEASFGSKDAFSQQFVSAATDHFGSGWIWLVLDDARLRIVSTDNAGTPLTTPGIPLLTLDVWEHAYYLDYQHRRLDYIAAFLAHLVDWEFAERNLQHAHRATALAS